MHVDIKKQVHNQLQDQLFCLMQNETQLSPIKPSEMHLGRARTRHCQSLIPKAEDFYFVSKFGSTPGKTSRLCRMSVVSSTHKEMNTNSSTLFLKLDFR